MKRFICVLAALVLSLRMLALAAAAAEVFEAAGAIPDDIQATVDAFRAFLGTNNGVGGSFSDGRREINWDAVPDAFAAPNLLPAGFFNVNSPRGQGAYGTGLGEYLVRLVLDPFCEKCSQTHPPRSVFVVVIGPMDNFSVLNTCDRCAAQGNWKAKVRGSIGHSLRCRKLPFSNSVISALEARIYFHHGVREKLPRFLKEFDQALFVRKLDVERMVGECEAVVKLIHSF